MGKMGLQTALHGLSLHAQVGALLAHTTQAPTGGARPRGVCLCLAVLSAHTHSCFRELVCLRARKKYFPSAFVSFFLPVFEMDKPGGKSLSVWMKWFESGLEWGNPNVKPQHMYTAAKYVRLLSPPPSCPFCSHCFLFVLALAWC